MKILVVGSGAREHALVWKLSLSNKVTKIICAPGNPGMDRLAQCVPVAADDIQGLLALAQDEDIDLTVVGPEVPLLLGIENLFSDHGLAIFAPSARASAIEGSKSLAKELLNQAGVSTAESKTFSDPSQAKAYVREKDQAMVVKVDGLAAGKGVVVGETIEETLGAIDTMLDKPDVDKIVVEEILLGQEVSVLSFCDGKHIRPMVWCQDHKRIYDQDKGPNTGGMGAYGPPSCYSPQLADQVKKEILEPMMRVLNETDRWYVGVLYAGLMLTEDGPKVLEFNARFGDPEAQVLMLLLKTDLVDIIMSCLGGRLDEQKIDWHDQAACTVVLASEGYPGDFAKGYPIEGILPPPQVFTAGVAKDEAGQLITSGGRVLSACGLAPTLSQAVEMAYEVADQIKFEGKYCRRDIGWQSL